MGIKPALGWLGLLLFTTTAQAGGASKLFEGAKSANAKRPPIVASVTPKTKAPPVAKPVVAEPTSTGALAVVESTVEPRGDYAAEARSTVPLDGPLAKERGYDGGLVRLVFEQERRAEFRVAKERIRRIVKLRSAGTATQSTTATSAARVDVLETDEGVIAIDTTTDGTFTTSDVYVFARSATLDQRIGALGSVPSPARERLREALVIAEWAPVTNAK